MFNSQRINNDPRPYVGWSGSRYDEQGRTYASLEDGPVDTEPRPEYDNNPNPILIYARNFLITDLSDDPIQNLLTWLDSDWTQISWIAGSREVAVDRIDHARKVLERLVNVYSD